MTIEREKSLLNFSSTGGSIDPAKQPLYAWRKFKELEEFCNDRLKDIQIASGNSADQNSFNSELFLSEFEKLVKDAGNLGCLYSETVLGFKLLQFSQLLDEADIEQFLLSVGRSHIEKVSSQGGNSKSSEGELELDIYETVRSYLIGLSGDKTATTRTIDNEADLLSELNSLAESSSRIRDDHFKSEPFHDDEDYFGDLMDDGPKSVSDILMSPVISKSEPNGHLFQTVKSEAGVKTAPTIQEKQPPKPTPCLMEVPDGFVYSCVECHYKTTNRITILSHLREEHEYIQRYITECPDCHLLFSNKKTLDTHQKNSHPRANAKNGGWLTRDVETYTCEKCGFEVSTLRSLRNHQESVHMFGSYNCDDCGENFINFLRLKRHLKTVHNDNRYDDTGATTKKKKKQQSKIYQCDFCDKQLKSHGRMKMHKAMHTGEDVSAMCSQCGGKFANKHTLRLHIKRVHDKVRYPCQHCDYKAYSTDHLQAHDKLVHKGEKLDCPYCEYKSTNLSEFYLHKRSHNPSGKQVDKKPQNQNSSAWRGERKAGKPKAKRAKPLSQERKEKLRAYGKVKHKCDQCDVYCTKSSLSRHKRNFHDAEKRFACNDCDYKTNTKNLLLGHFQRRHSGMRFQCDICPSSYSDQFALQLHKRKVHGIIPPDGRKNRVTTAEDC